MHTRRVGPSGGAGFKPPAHWEELDAADYTNWNCPPLLWIAENLFAVGTLTLIGGPSQASKTLFLLYICGRIVRGSKLFDRYTMTSVKIAYILLEDPKRRVKERLADMKAKLPPGRFIVLNWKDLDLTREEQREYMFRRLKAGGFGLAIIDTYQRATPGVSSFDDEKQSLILHALSAFTRQTDIAIGIVDHIRKTRSGTKPHQGEIEMDEVRGTGLKAHNADTVVTLSRGKGDIVTVVSKSKEADPVTIRLQKNPLGENPKYVFLDACDERRGRLTGNQKQAVVLDSVRSGRRTREEIEKHTGLCRTDVSSALAFQVRTKQIIRHGKGKATWYESSKKSSAADEVTDDAA